MGEVLIIIIIIEVEMVARLFVDGIALRDPDVAPILPGNGPQFKLQMVAFNPNPGTNTDATG